MNDDDQTPLTVSTVPSKRQEQSKSVPKSVQPISTATTTMENTMSESKVESNRGKRLTSDQIAKIEMMLEQGQVQSAIAQEVGVSIQTIGKLKRAKDGALSLVGVDRVKPEVKRQVAGSIAIADVERKLVDMWLLSDTNLARLVKIIMSE